MSYDQTYLLKKDTWGSSYSQYTVDRIIDVAVDKAVKQSHNALCDEKDGIKTMNQVIDRRIASDVKPMIMDCVDTINLFETNYDERLDKLEVLSLAMNGLLEGINKDIKQIDQDTNRFEADISELKVANKQYINHFINIDERINNVDRNYLKKAETDDVINAFIVGALFDVVGPNTVYIKNDFLERFNTSIQNTYLNKTDATSTYQTITDTTNKYNELKSLIDTRPTFDQVEYYFLTKEQAQKLVDQINLLIQQVSELNTKVETLESANQKHIEDINKLEGNVNKVNLENNQFQESIEALRNDLTENQKVDETQNTQIDGINQDIEDVQNDIGDIKSGIEDIKTVNETQGVKIEEIASTANKNALDITRIDKTVDGHTDSINQLDAEVFKGLN